MEHLHAQQLVAVHEGLGVICRVELCQTLNKTMLSDVQQNLVGYDHE
jgi:hypothetical protein